MNYAAIWKADWCIGSVLTLLFLLASYFGATSLQSLENKIYDISVSSAIHATDDRIVLLNIDEKSLAHMGQQSQQAIASIINKLSNARLIGIDMLFSEPEQSSTGHDSEQQPHPLAEAIRRSGNTLMPMFFEAGSVNEYANTILPNYLRRMTIKHINNSDNHAAPIKASHIRYPYIQLTQASAGLGHVSTFKDSDGVVRSEPLAIAFSGQYFPSLSLLLAAKTLNVPLDDIRINLGVDIELGALNIATDGQIRVYPSFYHGSQHTAFTTYSFYDLYSGLIPSDLFTGKIVLIGSASKRPGNTFATPVNSQMTRIEFSAHVLQSILREQVLQRPGWTHIIEILLLLLAGLYLILLLPRLNRSFAACLSSLLLIALIGTDFILLANYEIWLQTISAATLLFTGHLLLLGKNLFISNSQQQQSSNNLHDTNKMLGFSFQSQGMLDKAYEKFLACPLDEEMLSIFYELAQAFERKRQFKQAISVYAHIASHNPAYKDIPTRMIQARSANETQANKDPNTGLTTLLISGETKPTLGRYEIISELGKGAMGTVYLGKDPKINRRVAIKTMALSQEFEPDELEEVKAKFFHEAEIAGMLNHPNIVTIFDAGDEHDLAYIAMEFLDGVDLAPYTKKGKLLPLATTLKICAKVAEALQYAHANAVIHRDIKPANIMILKNKSVKVTDFGIAHIIDSSKTKAGVVLGTPSYMSPEQLSGKELDGRSDLFSLGVMLYELSCGVRPFRAESISKLMFKIAKQPHVDVREHNASVTDSVAMLIDRMLHKKCPHRIATASDVLTGIHHCLRDLKTQGGGREAS